MLLKAAFVKDSYGDKQMFCNFLGISTLLIFSCKGNNTTLQHVKRDDIKHHLGLVILKCLVD